MVSPATVVATTLSASDSNLGSGKGEWFRLQNATTPIAAAAKNGPPAALSWDAGRDRCHEGGIILSKKPPEWHLSLLQ